MVANRNPTYAEQELLEEYAPQKATCPTCGTVCPRHSKRSRTVKDITLDGDANQTITVGVYKCKVCKRHFRFQPPQVTKGKHYSDRSRTKAIQAVIQDQTTFEGVPRRLSRDFNIKPSSSSVYRWTHDYAGNLDFHSNYTPWAAENFSGVLVVDEMYDHFVILFATDPINNFTVGYQVSDNIGEDVMLQFLENLKADGINPEVFICDGSPLYTNTPFKVWPDVKMQQCVFHFVRNFTDDIHKSVRMVRKSIVTQANKTCSSDSSSHLT